MYERFHKLVDDGVKHLLATCARLISSAVARDGLGLKIPMIDFSRLLMKHRQHVGMEALTAWSVTFVE
jgi:hypothetical protein